MLTKRLYFSKYQFTIILINGQPWDEVKLSISILLSVSIRIQPIPVEQFQQVNILNARSWKIADLTI